MDIEDARAIMANLPDDLEVIVLSGGEPFVDIELLLNILREIRNRDFPELRQIGVLTTGFWATSRGYTKEAIGELLSLDVNMFAVGAFDKWHYEAGLRKELPELF